MNEFNYKDSLNGIKASLFDIYENQEQEIGLEQNPEKRNARLNKFIEVKDIALMLIEGIHYLYDDTVNQTSVIKEKLENPKMPSTVEESKLLNMVENSSMEGKENKEENSDFEEEFNEEEIELSEQEEENVANSNEVSNSEKLKKYYLDCDMKDVNFAYVPQSLYEKIKNYSLISKEEYPEEKEEEVDEVDDSEELKNQTFMKQDTEKPRGIIVRSDQYMKLALSKYRQEGVLKEARKYRIEEVKRKRREEQKRELEKAEVKIDI